MYLGQRHPEVFRYRRGRKMGEQTAGSWVHPLLGPLLGGAFAVEMNNAAGATKLVASAPWRSGADVRVAALIRSHCMHVHAAEGAGLGTLYLTRGW